MKCGLSIENNLNLNLKMIEDMIIMIACIAWFCMILQIIMAVEGDVTSIFTQFHEALTQEQDKREVSSLIHILLFCRTALQG